jgi:hypothetical protein
LFAAEKHYSCEWLLKVDIEDFFHSITERQVFAIFYRLGYPSLLAFEMARITTMVTDAIELRRAKAAHWPSIPYYQCEYEGVLPQGAPTSPMLSNLVMRDLDERLITLAAVHQMRYTRYADDLAFSTCKASNIAFLQGLRRRVQAELSREGFRHNKRKTVIRGPGTRRIVLGMLVDGPNPRLPREFKDKLRMHLFFLRSPAHGPSKHAEAQRTSVSSLYHYVRGLIGWAVSVEPEYGASVLNEFESVPWPPVQSTWT